MGVLFCEAVNQFPEWINKNVESLQDEPIKELQFFCRKRADLPVFTIRIRVRIPKK